MTNLIGISGYVGSGKDTVGKIIQYLDSECSNKEGDHYRTFQEFLTKGQGNNDFQSWYYSNHDWKIKKFAFKLKQTASILTGIPIEKFEDQRFKNSPLDREWCFKASVAGYGEKWQEMSVRMFLQKLGTEAIRDNLHSETWVNALFADYVADIPIVKEGFIPYGRDYCKLEDYKNGIGGDNLYTKEEANDFIYPNWIITDTRFPNEAQAIKDRGGIIIRVNRTVVHPELGEGKVTYIHPSETALDNWEFDYVIENNGTLEELIEKVRVIWESGTQ